MTLNWGAALRLAAAGGAAYLAWRKIGAATKEELRLRAQLAGSALLGNPVAYRVTLAKSGPGAGISVSAAPSMVSQCTVIGVQGNGMNFDFGHRGEGAGGLPDEHDDPGGWGWSNLSAAAGDGALPEDGEEEDAADELLAAPHVVPAVCEDGHVSWPAHFARLHDTATYTAWTPTRLGDCPECGKPRSVLPGVYRAGEDGYVTRAELRGEG